MLKPTRFFSSVENFYPKVLSFFSTEYEIYRKNMGPRLDYNLNGWNLKKKLYKKMRKKSYIRVKIFDNFKIGNKSYKFEFKAIIPLCKNGWNEIKIEKKSR